MAAPIAASRAARTAKPVDARPPASPRAIEPPPSAGIGLPPPPDFLSHGLEGDDPAEHLTLTGIPPVLADRSGEGVERDSSGRSVVEPLDDVERDSSGRSVVEALEDLHGGPGRPVHLVDTGRRTPVSARHATVRDGDDGEWPSARTSDDASAGDEVDIDLDASEDTLPRLAPAGLGREPYPELPPAPSQVPTAPVPVVSQASAAPPRARTGRFAALVPAPTRRPLALWIGVGAGVGVLISIVALVWLSTSSPDKDASPEPAPTPAADVKASKGDRDREPAPTPAPVPKTEAAPPAPAPEAKADVAPPPAEPETAEPEPAPAPDGDASVITVARDRSSYDAAKAEYAATGSQKALLAMTTAACAIDDGPRARAAFRKLVGRALRTKAMTACRAAKVDVTATVEGWTGPELLAQARAALAAGDAQTALDKAHASNKVERTSEAVLVKGLAACKLGDGDQAQRLLPHVAVKARPRLVEGCREAGVELRG